jgi:hypothetical protein
MLTRALKEFRLLAWPSALIVAGTAASGALAMRSGDGGVLLLPAQLAVIALYIGTPLIAACSFGMEFQQRTLVLLLSQPESRTRIWLQKLLVLSIAAGASWGSRRRCSASGRSTLHDRSSSSCCSPRRSSARPACGRSWRGR